MRVHEGCGVAAARPSTKTAHTGTSSAEPLATRIPLPARPRDKDAEQQLAAERRQQRAARQERQQGLDAAWDG
jgi:hypothetical protein